MNTHTILPRSTTDRQAAGRLRLVERARAAESKDVRPTAERLSVRQTPRVQRFLAEAASQGLAAEDAVRLALERHAALQDLRAMRLDESALKAILDRAAVGAHPSRPLSPTEARYARSLSFAAPCEASAPGEPVEIALPERLLTRIGSASAPSALDRRVVAEMIAWELAATFTGRTMSEWAFAMVAAHTRAAAGIG
jgi:hypothetical protein